MRLRPQSALLIACAVDRLRVAAGTIIEPSPEFQRLLQDLRGRTLPVPPQKKAAAP